MTEYDKHNLFETELILDYLDGILLSDLQQLINEELKASEAFKTFVEGVKTTYQEAGNDRVLMQKNMDKAKVRTLEKLSSLFPQTTFSIQDAIDYTREQLIRFFTPVPLFDLALTTRASSLLKKPEQDTDATGSLILEFHHIIPDFIECAIVGNDKEELVSYMIPPDISQYIIDTSMLDPGVYYLDLVLGDHQEMLRFYIEKHLKPN